MRVARAFCLAIGLALLAASALLGGPHSPLGYLLPIALVFAPLLAGRYPGERALARLGERLRPAPPREVGEPRASMPPFVDLPRSPPLVSGFQGGRAPPVPVR